MCEQVDGCGGPGSMDRSVPKTCTSSIVPSLARKVLDLQGHFAMSAPSGIMQIP